MMDQGSRNGCAFKDTRFTGVLTKGSLKIPYIPEVRIADGRGAHLSLHIRLYGLMSIAFLFLFC
jgi:hypothetical protein